MPSKSSPVKHKPVRLIKPKNSAVSTVGSVSGTSHSANRSPLTHWQPASRGTHHAEYQIYLTAAQDLGWTVKTFDEWLAS